MTEEEIRALQDAVANAERQLADLTAERDSLQEENERLRTASQEAQKELAETKKMNFTLARQIDRQPAKSAEEIINEMF